MRKLNKLKLQRLMLIGLLLLLPSLNGCKSKKIPMYKLCVTLESVGFGCADQRLPDEKNGKVYPYSPGWICMPPDDYKIINDFMIEQAKYIMTLESRSCN